MRRLMIVSIIAALFIMTACSPAGSNSPESTNLQTPQEKVPQAPAATAEPNPADSFRFVMMADSRGSDRGINSKIVKKTMERIKLLSPQPAFAFMPGDLVDGAKSYTGVKSQLEYFKKTITSYYPETFFYPGLGNHETSNGSGGERAFAEVFPAIKATSFLEGYGKTVYYLDYGKFRLFMLDTDYPKELHKVSDKQLNWVKANLDTTGGNLFFLHEPPYPTGANIGFSLDKNPLQCAKLWDLIDSAVNPMVFCSHEHNYTRRHIDSAFNTTIGETDFKFDKSVYQLTSGGFGAPFYKQFESKKNVDVPPVVENNFLVVDINGTEITVKAYNLEGKLIDSFSQKV